MNEMGPCQSGRKEMTATVTLEDVPGEMNFISGDVEIAISGASEEAADVCELVEDVEEAVIEAVESFEAIDYAAAHDK